MNRGAMALAAVTESTSQVEVAKRTGISQSWLSRLTRAEKQNGVECKPNREQSVALKRELGIEIEWWDEEVPPDTERAAS